jgi:hypothetical protein
MVQFRGMILCCEYNDGDYAQKFKWDYPEE